MNDEPRTDHDRLRQRTLGPLAELLLSLADKMAREQRGTPPQNEGTTERRSHDE